jgi:hypothetical protein
MLCAAAGCQKDGLAGVAERSQTTFVVQSLAIPGLVRVDWNLKFYFLESTPPAMYSEYPVSSGMEGGRFTAVLPCLTNASGTGQNQVQAVAQLWFTGQTAPVVGTGTAIFTCVRSADTPVSLVISIRLPADAGFNDVIGKVNGISCASKIDYKSDAWLAVCGASSCGDAQAMFLFANACQSLDGTSPDFLACGSSTDWTLQGVLAASQFPVPSIDGAWTFGVTALPSQVLTPPDLTLTDATGKLRVYKQVPTPSARLLRASGTNQGTIDADRFADFAADLVLPATAPGAGTPHQLLELRNGLNGSAASVWTSFGPCDAPTAGVQGWSGLYVIDARLHDAASVDLILSAQPGGLASKKARCTAIRGADGTPQISCTAAGSLT